MLYLIYLIAQYRNDARARAEARVAAATVATAANDTEYKLAA